MPKTLLPTAEKTHYSRQEMADRWSVSLRTIDAAIAAGEIKVVRFGRAVRGARDEVQRIDREGFAPSN
ncbi:MAG: excisionase family DNA-binding protein [Planctomycetota bacterium]